ncbi:MOSC domain-containing protein [Robiginitomaculum antarcticum]|uniref:MOSC domain-containing protein n=1 Tax=Robiginitomaculum antarcticum TaxID=437507 RepID=UPI00036B9946|nr:MOSC domain-containing protein [Robiginitomaculum antarcticum]
MSRACVIAVAQSASHSFTKHTQLAVSLIAGFGVQGDAHYGQTVQHIYDKRRDPLRPNLRQVHLIHSELFDEMSRYGYDLGAGQLGENITTRGIDLINLPTGTQLTIGEAQIEVTGLRKPCSKINALGEGLMARMIEKAPSGDLILKCGVMGIITQSGEVMRGDNIDIKLPDLPHRPLGAV